MAQAARRFGLPERTVRYWCETGKLAAISKAYGSKTRYLVSSQAMELLLASLAEEVEEKQAKKRKPVDHADALERWKTAMRNGMTTGKAFSPLTISYYSAYTRDFLDKHGTLSIRTFKTELGSLPPTQFARRYKLYKALISFSKFLVGEGQLDASFLSEAKPMLPRRHKPPKRLVLDEAEVETLINACNNVYERLIVILLYSTGLRAAEACALKWQDIDLMQGVVIVRCGKGGKMRAVGITPKLVEALTDLLSKTKSHQANASVLTEADGKPLDRYGLYRSLKRVGERAAIEVSPHALRRAFVTINANKGRPLQMLQLACGHSDLRTTMSYCLTTEREVVMAMREWE